MSEKPDIRDLELALEGFEAETGYVIWDSPDGAWDREPAPVEGPMVLDQTPMLAPPADAEEGA